MWGETNSPLKKWVAKSQGIWELWTDIMEKMPIKYQEPCILIFQNIWHQHNPFLYDNIFMCHKQLVIASTMKQRDAFQDAASHETRKGETTCGIWLGAEKKWVKLQGTEVKTN